MRMRRFALVPTAILISVMLILIIFFTLISTHRHSTGSSSPQNHLNNSPTSSGNRKLQVFGTCTNRDISISQIKDTNAGIPRYIVQIVNTCVSGCSPSHIHLHCSWFASDRLVNPTTFKRLSYDDCLVNAGKPLQTGQIIRFTYLNSFMYPLSFKSARFC